MTVMNQLYASKKLTLGFRTVEERENFRTQLYKVKQTQDTYLAALDCQEERLVLKCRLSKVDPDSLNEATIELWLEKPKKPTFTILSSEELPQVKTEETDGASSG